MGSVTRFAAAVGFAGAAAALCAFPAEAGCKRMAFSVNDYGKEGPTKDSQDLLEKHIATWAAEQGIEKYTVGKKDVSCELFLNLIVVDEHTCTARATVCWGGDKLPSTQEAKKKGGEKAAATAKADATGDAAAAAKPEESKDAKPAGAKAAEATTSAAPSSGDGKPAAAPAAQVETGALPLTNKGADTAAKAADATEKPADKPAGDTFSVSERDAVAAAAAAAERAAAAAERAAAAAERAAAAATEANAARAQAANSSSSAAPEPPAYGAASQPVVAPIQPEANKQ